jgi:hypothetical protein
VICQEENTIYYKIFLEFFGAGGLACQTTRGYGFSTPPNKLLPSQHKKKAEISLGSFGLA